MVCCRTVSPRAEVKAFCAASAVRGIRPRRNQAEPAGLNVLGTGLPGEIKQT